MPRTFILATAIALISSLTWSAVSAEQPVQHCWLVSYSWILTNDDATMAASGFGSFQALEAQPSTNTMLSYAELVDRLRQAKELSHNPGKLTPLAVSPIVCSPELPTNL